MYLPTINPTPTPIDQLHAATALYTSTHVVDNLLDRINWPQTTGNLLDPAAGDGAFVLRALERLKPIITPESIMRIQGWEIHAGAAHEAQTRVAAFLEQHHFTPTAAYDAAQRMIINKDFLTNGPPPGQFKLICGNPPFLRYAKLPNHFKQIYASHLPKYALADILHSFIDACTKSLPADGVIAIICSDRVLFNHDAARLRETIGQTLGISHLARIDPSTSFYRPKKRIRNSPPRIHPIEILLTPLSTGSFPITRAAISPDEPGYTEPPGPTLQDIAKVSLAPWLGPMGIFVITGNVATHLAKHNATLIPAVDTDDIDAKLEVIRTPTRFAIKTTKEEPPTGPVDTHLREQRHRMPKRGLKRAYWLPPETINLAIDQPSLLIPRIAKTLRAIPLPPGLLPINHNLSIVSSNHTDLEYIRELLLSEKSQQWIKRHAPRLDGGYFSITTKLLRRLPI